MEVLEEMNDTIIKITVDTFVGVQRAMLKAKKEEATETYEELHYQYISLKATLTTLGVNLSEIDLIKE